MTSFLQINEHTSKEAQSLALKTMSDLNAAALIMSEPNCLSDQPGWINSTDRKCAIYVAETVDIADSGHGCGFAWADILGQRLVSCCISPNSGIEQFTNFLWSLEQCQRSCKSNIILAGDFNTHGIPWGVIVYMQVRRATTQDNGIILVSHY